jgi:FkbM family methyltransferase
MFEKLNLIKMKLISKIKRRIWRLFFKNARLSYSQSGEDLILETIFCDISKGVYVDIGANNPYIQSNTQYFYKKGWRGVNVDALPGSMIIFNKVRSKDINIETAISNENSELKYYMFSSTFFNTFDQNLVEKIKNHSKLIGEKTINSIKLSDLFNSLKINTIDFLSVDVEGLDYEVLKSNDWEKYRPKVIVTECFSDGLELLHLDKLYQFLKGTGYILFCNSPTNAFYLEKEFFKDRFASKNV